MAGGCWRLERGQQGTVVLAVLLLLSMGMAHSAAADHDPDEEEIEIDLTGPAPPYGGCVLLFDGYHAQEEAAVEENRNLVPERTNADVGPAQIGIEGLDNATTVEINESYHQNVTIGETQQEIGNETVLVPGSTVHIGEESLGTEPRPVEVPGHTVTVGPVDRSVTLEIEEGIDGDLNVTLRESVDETVPGLVLCMEYFVPIVSGLVHEDLVPLVCSTIDDLCNL